MRKVLSLILAFILIMACAVPAFAATVPEDTVVSPQYTYIKTLAANLTIDENTGVASCRAYCYAASNYTVEVECILQRYVGAIWTPLKTWTSSSAGYASVDQDWAVYKGYNYRIYVTYRIRTTAGALLESTTVTRYYAY